MKDIFTKSKWIWKNGGSFSDEYVEFKSEFNCCNSQKVILNLSFDTVCNVFVNGQLVYFKQCSDYPHYKIFDQVDITKYCKDKNNIEFFVWYFGEGNFTYYPSNAGLIFEIKQGDDIILSSDENVLSRQDLRYKNGYKKMITAQLGYSFFYDNSFNNELPYQKSVKIDNTYNLFANRLKHLTLLDKTPCIILRQDDTSALIDLASEQAGFLSIDIFSQTEQSVLIAYGEHIVDGKVRRIIGQRDFSVELKLKKGKNLYTNFFRRLAGRYIEIFYSDKIDINYLGIIPVVYPLEIKPFKAKTDLQQKIYDVSVKTLSLCLHEHYEDCPWREQSMYIMDTRNQMRCGYYAFNNLETVYSAIKLMAMGQKENGLFELTFPAQVSITIPSFALTFPAVVYEYVLASEDKCILLEMLSVIDRLMNYFIQRIGSNGLFKTVSEQGIWHFYEWADSLDGNFFDENQANKERNEFDVLINAYISIACDYCSKLYSLIDDNNNAKKYIDLRNNLNKAINANFYVQTVGLYKTRDNGQEFSALANALCVLCGACSKEKQEIIAENLAYGNNFWVNNTLSMNLFKYDALIKVDKEKYSKFIIEDIEKQYGYMLEKGATSFWETIKGDADFDNAGSLCHGWSAMPIYYFNILK